MIGPSIAGILIAAFGGAVGFAMAAGASYVALVLYSRLRVEGHTPARDGQHVLQQFVEGLSFVGNNFVFASLIAPGALQQPVRPLVRDAAADLRRLVLRQRLDRLRPAERRARQSARWSGR